jgi:hypothetical protein
MTTQTISSDTKMVPRELTLIVAATTKMGIGKAGTLPWTGLKKEMAYFARITKRANPGVRFPQGKPQRPDSGVDLQFSNYGTKDMGEHPTPLPALERSRQYCRHP